MERSSSNYPYDIKRSLAFFFLAFAREMRILERIDRRDQRRKRTAQRRNGGRKKSGIRIRDGSILGTIN